MTIFNSLTSCLTAILSIYLHELECKGPEYTIYVNQV